MHQLCECSVYVLCGTGAQTWKLHGLGPDVVTQRTVAHYFKFDTGSSGFKELPSKGTKDNLFFV